MHGGGGGGNCWGNCKFVSKGEGGGGVHYRSHLRPGSSRRSTYFNIRNNYYSGRLAGEVMVKRHYGNYLCFPEVGRVIRELKFLPSKEGEEGKAGADLQ